MQKPLGLYPLPRSDGLTTEEALQLLRSPSDDIVIVPCIPKGTKNNVFCLIDNSENQKRQTLGQNRTYDDDCGAWQSSKSKSAISPYVTDGQNGLKRVFWIASWQAYCNEAKVDGKRVYNPLNPQPLPDTVIKIRRYYVTLAANDDYKRRITTLVDANVTAEHNVAIVEYFGENAMGTVRGQNKDVKCENQRKCSLSSTVISHAESAEDIEDHCESNDR